MRPRTYPPWVGDHVPLLQSRASSTESEAAFHYALDVVSHSVLGVSFGLLENTTHRWLTESLVSGNLHMYLQLAWPALFSRLRGIFDVTAVTYPRYHEDSRRFLDLCRSMSTQVDTKPPNASLALMTAASPASVPDEDVRLEAFSYIRGGKLHPTPPTVEHRKISIYDIRLSQVVIPWPPGCPRPSSTSCDTMKYTIGSEMRSETHSPHVDLSSPGSYWRSARISAPALKKAFE